MKTTFSYPEWDEIPNIDLYLDQVLLYVNKVCSPISLAKEKGLTASMVNNYVKHGYISKPEKKKYQRKQTQEGWKLGRTETVVFSDFINAYPNYKVVAG